MSDELKVTIPVSQLRAIVEKLDSALNPRPHYRPSREEMQAETIQLVRDDVLIAWTTLRNMLPD